MKNEDKRSLMAIVCDDYCKHPEKWAEAHGEDEEDEMYGINGPCWSCKVAKKINEIGALLTE